MWLAAPAVACAEESHRFLGKDNAWAAPPDTPALQPVQSLPGSAEGGLVPPGLGLSAHGPVFIDLPKQPTSRFWKVMGVSGLGVQRPLSLEPGGVPLGQWPWGQ